MSLENRALICVTERRARRTSKTRRCSFRGMERGRWYTRTHGVTHERIREWLLASPLSFLSPLFFFFTWATWRRVLTPGDSCEGSSFAASPVVCDSGLPLVTKRKRNRAISRSVGKGRRYVLVDERIPRVFDGRTPLDSSWSSTITTDSNSIRCFTWFSHMVLIFLSRFLFFSIFSYTYCTVF